MINLFHTYISSSALQSIEEVIQSNLLSEGEVVKKFELELDKALGLKNSCAVNSGTSALHLALDLAGVGEGDEVILPAQTFVSSGLVVLQRNAKPVFADINPLDGTILLESIRKNISSKTKAILPVHWGGYPCDMNEINALAKHNIKVIEDAAHALGATYHSIPIGAISDYTCFSFQSIKHLTTGDGGAICCKDNLKHIEANTKRWFGINREQSQLSELGERSYNISELGYKYHMNNFAASLGLANLEGYKSRLEQRKKLAEFYTTSLRNTNGVQLFDYKPDRQSAFWLYGIHVENRLEFIRALKTEGIASSVVHQRRGGGGGGFFFFFFFF